MSWFYRFIRGLLRLGLRAYFRDIETHGADQVPRDGPVVFIANHHNGMIDPFLLIAASPRPVTFIAKAPLFRIPVLGWILRALHAIPAARQQDTGYSREQNEALYAAAGGMLAEGRAVGLFPEGKSHVDPTLAGFKHGASKIAFEAAATGAPVRVQLVGIHFEVTRGFRGRVLLQFGPTVDLAPHRENYAKDPRAAVAALTEELHARLSSMVLTAENEEILRLAGLVERMGVLDASGETDMKSAFARKKAFLDGYARLKKIAPVETAQLEEDLRHYRTFLDDLGVRDDQIAHDYSAGRAIAYALRNTIALALGLPFLAVGFACNLVPYLVGRLLASIPREFDVKTSVGFMVSIVLFPTAWAALAWVAWRYAAWPGAAAVLVAAPLTGAIALRWMDRWHAVLRATWGLWTAIALPVARARLRRMRARIVARAERLIAIHERTA